MRIGVVGATGLVGQSFLKILSGSSENLKELRLFSRNPTRCFFQGKHVESQPIKQGSFKGLDICFFSAGEKVSQYWAPLAQKEGALIIDNSSAFRKDPKIPLVVPEINGNLLSPEPQIISNPNCSTIQLVMALYPLHQAFGLEEVRVVSLQSISGAGKEALDSFKKESCDILEGREAYEEEKMKKAFNCVPYIGEIREEGFCKEELKIIQESKKIMNLPDLKISAFSLRVPSLNSHGEVVWFSLKNSPSTTDAIHSVLRPFVQVHNEKEEPPHGRLASGKEKVFVGRIHKDNISENSWVLWIVADNLLKGASLNGLQIAEKIGRMKQ